MGVLLDVVLGVVVVITLVCFIRQSHVLKNGRRTLTTGKQYA